MKALVVYYSRTGITKKTAALITELLSCDMEEIIDQKKRKGPIGFLTAAKDAAKRNTTRINPMEKDPAEYDVVIIGTPVWAGNMTPAIRTYLENYKEKIKKAAFFLTTAKSGIEKTFHEMEEVYGKPPAATLPLYTSEVKKGKTREKVQKFCENLK